MTKEKLELLKSIKRNSESDLEYAKAQVKLFNHYYSSLIDSNTAIEFLKNISPKDNIENYSYYQYVIGRIYFQELDNINLAQIYWEQAILDDDFNYKEELKVLLSNIYLLKNDIDEALNILKSCLSSDISRATYDIAVSNLAFLYIKKNDINKAFSLWLDISEYYGKNTFENNLSAQLYVYAQLYLYKYKNDDKYINELKAKKHLIQIDDIDDYILDLFEKILDSQHFIQLSRIFCTIDTLRENLYVDVISSRWERELAHYTSTEVLNNLLCNDQGRLRLNNIYNMNDPTEGNVVKDFLQLNNTNNEMIKSKSNTKPLLEYVPFIACFTFNHDSLNQFRLYGKTNNQEATGISIVLSNDFFGLDLGITQSIKNTHKFDSRNINLNGISVYKQAVYRCIYIDPNTDYITIAKREKSTFYREFSCGQQKKDLVEIELEWENYSKFINELENKIKNTLSNLKFQIQNLLQKVEPSERNSISDLINLSLLPLKFLVKHIAFEHEQECRICYISSLKDKNVVMDFQKQWLYINYPSPIKQDIKYIYVSAGAKKFYPFIVKLLDGQADKVKISDNPFRVN